MNAERPRPSEQETEKLNRWKGELAALLEVNFDSGSMFLYPGSDPSKGPSILTLSQAVDFGAAHLLAMRDLKPQIIAMYQGFYNAYAKQFPESGQLEK